MLVRVWRSRPLGIPLATFLESILAVSAKMFYSVHILKLSRSASQKPLLNKEFQNVFLKNRAKMACQSSGNILPALGIDGVSEAWQ